MSDGVSSDARDTHDAVATALAAAVTNRGVTLADLSDASPLLVVCLRHFGCLFCKEAIAELSANRSEIEAGGTRIVLVHMSPPDEATAYFAERGLPGVDHVSDPGRELYRALELGRLSIGQMLLPRVWWRGFTAFVRGHRPGRVAGDAYQMPGAFLVHRGRIVRAYRHETAGDRPDYCELAAS